jgi:hypothetical protein
MPISSWRKVSEKCSRRRRKKLCLLENSTPFGTLLSFFIVALNAMGFLVPSFMSWGCICADCASFFSSKDSGKADE